MMEFANRKMKFKNEIESYLEGRNFDFKFDEDSEAYSLKIHDIKDSERTNVFKFVLCDVGIMVMLETDLYVDTQNSNQMACIYKYINSANQNSWAKLQMVNQDGQIQIRFFILCEDLLPSAAMLENSFNMVMHVYNTNAKDLQAIVDGPSPP